MPGQLETSDRFDAPPPLVERPDLGGDIFNSLSDFKAIFANSGKGSSEALKDFGDLELVDVIAKSGKSVSNNEREFERENPPFGDRDSSNTKTDLDSDGEVRRGIVVDPDGLRARELEIPKGHVPLDPGPEKPRAPEDRFVDIDNQAPSVIIFDRDNSSIEKDSDGEFARLVHVEQGGAVTKEVTVD
jgi:hypothetical protein